MSKWKLAGSVVSANKEDIHVWAHADGRVSLEQPDHEGCDVILSPAERDKLRELLDRAAMPGQPAPCAYCEDDPDHPDPDDAGSCTCRSPGCGRGWCPKRDDEAAMPGQVSGE